MGVDERREASGQLVRDDLLLVVCDNAGMVFIPDPGLALPGPTGRSHYAMDGGAATRTSPPTPRPGGWNKASRVSPWCATTVAPSYWDSVRRGARLPVFAETDDRWERIATIRLPVPFDDYAGVTVADDRSAIVSQESSALWRGRLDPRTWAVDEGVVHEFPRDKHGRPRFTAVEAWRSRGRPDRAHGSHERAPPQRCGAVRRGLRLSGPCQRLNPPTSLSSRSAPVVRGLFPEV